MNFNIEDKKELLFVTLISTALAAYYVNYNMHLGIYCSDVYVYLLNALYFAGTNVHSTKSIFLSPVISFITSLIFRMGFVDKSAIFIVTGIFAIFGNVAMYLLLRLRFDKLMSVCGTIIYACFALNLAWLANGSLDIPAISVTIWIAYLFILAVKKDPKYFILALPLLPIGFFTRYTVAMILAPLLLYYIHEKSFKIDRKDLKYILIGLFLLIVAAGIILSTINTMGDGYLGFDGLLKSGVKGNLGSAHDNSYNPNIGYYLVNMGSFISTSNTTFVGKTPTLNTPTILTGLVFLILIAGAFLWAKRSKFEIGRTKIIGMALCLIALLTFNQFTSAITIFLVFLGLLLMGKDSENKFAYFMLCWLLVYLIFQSYYVVKVNRYIIPIFPPLAYFIMVGVEEINNKTSRKNILPIILIVLFLIQGFAFTFTIEETNEFNAPELMTDYIKANVDNWSEIQIGNYNIRPYYWFLGDKSPGIESKDTQKIIDSNVTYYISNRPQPNLTGYKEIKQIENLYLYEKTG